MDRKEVEALLAETKDPMIAALCRTQLAVWDAPKARLESSGDLFELIASDGDSFVTLGKMDRQRVRIVPEEA